MSRLKGEQDFDRIELIKALEVQMKNLKSKIELDLGYKHSRRDASFQNELDSLVNNNTEYKVLRGMHNRLVLQKGKVYKLDLEKAEQVVRELIVKHFESSSKNREQELVSTSSPEIISESATASETKSEKDELLTEYLENKLPAKVTARKALMDLLGEFENSVEFDTGNLKNDNILMAEMKKLGFYDFGSVAEQIGEIRVKLANNQQVNFQSVDRLLTLMKVASDNDIGLLGVPTLKDNLSYLLEDMNYIKRNTTIPTQPKIVNYQVTSEPDITDTQDSESLEVTGPDDNGDIAEKFTSESKRPPQQPKWIRGVINNRQEHQQQRQNDPGAQDNNIKDLLGNIVKLKVHTLNPPSKIGLSAQKEQRAHKENTNILSVNIRRDIGLMSNKDSQERFAAVFDGVMNNNLDKIKTSMDNMPANELNALKEGLTTLREKLQQKLDSLSPLKRQEIRDITEARRNITYAILECQKKLPANQQVSSGPSMIMGRAEE